ncbi:MAG: alpha/beta family hydrolase [bacterium]
MAGFLVDGDQQAPATVLLAHGAGAPMDSTWMDAVAKALAAARLRVIRFQFAYMAARRAGVRKPPPRAELLVPEYRAAVGAEAPLIIGGKSMGGRVVSMVADELYAAGKTSGLLCLGYPFHPLGKPAQPRTGHLVDLKAPSLICQGTRDPLGTREEVLSYELSERIEILWFEDGDHDLKPRKTVSGIERPRHISDDLMEERRANPARKPGCDQKAPRQKLD